MEGLSSSARRRLQSDASECPGNAVITRRRMLAATGGLAALATAGPAAAETPTLPVPTK